MTDAVFRTGIVASLLLVSCFSPKPDYLDADFDELQPKTVCVVMPDNETRQDFHFEVAELIEERLEQRGYEVVDEGADAFLYSTILEWSSDYEPPPEPCLHRVKLDAALVDVETDRQLWYDRASADVDYEDVEVDEGDPVFFMLTAPFRAMSDRPDYRRLPEAPLELARKAVKRLFQSLPRR